jgi:hypothetical protein
MTLLYTLRSKRRIQLGTLEMRQIGNIHSLTLELTLGILWLNILLTYLRPSILLTYLTR